MRPADIKSDSRLNAFMNIRNQISCAAAMKYIFQSANHCLFFSRDDVSILVNKMDDVKPKVILTKEAIEFLNSHHLSISTEGAQEQQRICVLEEATRLLQTSSNLLIAIFKT